MQLMLTAVHIMAAMPTVSVAILTNTPRITQNGKKKDVQQSRAPEFHKYLVEKAQKPAPSTNAKSSRNTGIAFRPAATGSGIFAAVSRTEMGTSRAKPRGLERASVSFSPKGQFYSRVKWQILHHTCWLVATRPQQSKRRS